MTFMTGHCSKWKKMFGKTFFTVSGNITPALKKKKRRRREGEIGKEGRKEGKKENVPCSCFIWVTVITSKIVPEKVPRSNRDLRTFLKALPKEKSN